MTARKPNEQHRRDGTLHTTRHVKKQSSDVAEVAPYAPELFDLPVLDVFQQLIGEGVLWLARTDTPKLLMVRDALVERQRLLQFVAEDESDHRARLALRALNKEITTLMSELGFDPAARSRLGLDEVKAQSKLEELRARRADAVRSTDG